MGRREKEQVTVSKGPREFEVELGRGTCIFGAMWFLLSQLTSCLAPACLWGPEKLPLLPGSLLVILWERVGVGEGGQLGVSGAF